MVAAADIRSVYLGKRERSTLEYAAQGLTNDEIAVIHGTRPLTEKKRVAVVVKKLRARNRTHAVVLALLRGIIQPPDVTKDASTFQTGHGAPAPHAQLGKSEGPS